jgi:hypothetical protein
VHPGDADQARTERPHVVPQRTTETEIGDGDAVASGLECCRDIFHAERLDAEERTEAETLVRGHGTKQQNGHDGRSATVT